MTTYLSNFRPLGNESGLIIVRLNKCNKLHCTKCPHGPYYYHRRLIKKQRKEQYLGHEHSDHVQALLTAKLQEEASYGR
jgi:hypothetical protein